MKEEISVLHTQGTWSLVPLPANKNLVGCKWIFKLKRHSYGSIAWHKARLVAKGFTQEKGVNYVDKYSPVMRYENFRLVLAIAAMAKWELRQLDAKNAFLNGKLDLGLGWPVFYSWIRHTYYWHLINTRCYWIVIKGMNPIIFGGGATQKANYPRNNTFKL